MIENEHKEFADLLRSADKEVEVNSGGLAQRIVARKRQRVESARRIGFPVLAAAVCLALALTISWTGSDNDFRSERPELLEVTQTFENLEIDERFDLSNSFGLEQQIVQSQNEIRRLQVQLNSLREIQNTQKRAKLREELSRTEILIPEFAANIF